MIPQHFDETETPLSQFPVQRRLQNAKYISLRPHFVGSENHKQLDIFEKKPSRFGAKDFYYGRLFKE